jgi:hypothetical protein
LLSDDGGRHFRLQNGQYQKIEAGKKDARHKQSNELPDPLSRFGGIQDGDAIAEACRVEENKPFCQGLPSLHVLPKCFEFFGVMFSHEIGPPVSQST